MEMDVVISSWVCCFLFLNETEAAYKLITHSNGDKKHEVIIYLFLLKFFFPFFIFNYLFVVMPTDGDVTQTDLTFIHSNKMKNQIENREWKKNCNDNALLRSPHHRPLFQSWLFLQFKVNLTIVFQSFLFCLAKRKTSMQMATQNIVRFISNSDKCLAWDKFVVVFKFVLWIQTKKKLAKKHSNKLINLLLRRILVWTMATSSAMYRSRSRRKNKRE